MENVSTTGLDLEAFGGCFLLLLWVESTMRDFVTLSEGGDDMRRRYNGMRGTGKLPRDFSRRRLELGRHSFGRIKNKFLDIWPDCTNQPHLREAIERAVIARNAIGHAQIDFGRAYLLYTPTITAWEVINRYTRCAKCEKLHGNCQCVDPDIADPLTLKLNPEYLGKVCLDAETIDRDSFLPTAKRLGIAYHPLPWWALQHPAFGENG